MKDTKGRTQTRTSKKKFEMDKRDAYHDPSLQSNQKASRSFGYGYSYPS